MQYLTNAINKNTNAILYSGCAFNENANAILYNAYWEK